MDGYIWVFVINWERLQEGSAKALWIIGMLYQILNTMVILETRSANSSYVLVPLNQHLSRWCVMRKYKLSLTSPTQSELREGILKARVRGLGLVVVSLKSPSRLAR